MNLFQSNLVQKYRIFQVQNGCVGVPEGSSFVAELGMVYSSPEGAEAGLESARNNGKAYGTFLIMPVYTLFNDFER